MGPQKMTGLVIKAEDLEVAIKRAIMEAHLSRQARKNNKPRREVEQGKVLRLHR